MRIVEQGGTLNGVAIAPITYGPFGLSLYERPMHQQGSRASMTYIAADTTSKWEWMGLLVRKPIRCTLMLRDIRSTLRSEEGA